MKQPLDDGCVELLKGNAGRCQASRHEALGMEIWIHAPKNFRPRDWVERLQDFDVVFGLDPYLVDPRIVDVDSEKREVLAVLCTLLDL